MRNLYNLTRDLDRPNRFTNGDTLEITAHIREIVMTIDDPLPEGVFYPLKGDRIETKYGSFRVLWTQGRKVGLEDWDTDNA